MKNKRFCIELFKYPCRVIFWLIPHWDNDFKGIGIHIGNKAIYAGVIGND